MATIALVGNPNCGKTTLFNALTGSRQHVGNWPGVTVERKSGFFIHQHIRFEVVDLPGVYSLLVASDTAAIDESIACDYILRQEADVIINILDGSNLERHLYLTMQLLEMGVPLIVVVNRMDVAQSRGIHLQLDRLSTFLRCPVVPLQANKGKGLDALKKCLLNKIAIEKSEEFQISSVRIPYAEPLSQAITDLAGLLKSHPASCKQQLQGEGGSLGFSSAWLASRLLEEDVYAWRWVSPALRPPVAALQKKINQEAGEDADILLADGRYSFIQQVVSGCVSRVSEQRASWTARLDKVILNRILGLPIFLAVMYFLFFFAINIGGAFQDCFDIASNTLLVDGLHPILLQLGLPTMLVTLLANGLGKGLSTTLTFIPVIGALFLCLSFLEDSGYMARAAFVVDRVMRAFGLPGKAFVPMIVGFGCNVPAVMAARTLENRRDRILTIMMSPFMSCGARLAIYAVFTAAFFPTNGNQIVFLLYLIGILMAVLTGFVLRKTLLFGQPAPMVMELPPYHFPPFYTLFAHAWQRLKVFIFRAGKLIVPVCMLLSLLHAININGTIHSGEADAQSLLSAVGRFITPLFAPMGIHQDNWPATVGLVTGILAKEVVVGTLNTLYLPLAQVASLSGTFPLWEGLHAALLSIGTNFSQLGAAVAHPFTAAAPAHAFSPAAYGLLYQHFDGQVGAFSYLLFVLLYFPCISTTAAMLRELNKRWAVFSVLWMSAVAYGTAVIFYQTATWTQHTSASVMWVLGILLSFAALLATLHLWMAQEYDKAIMV